MLDTLRASARKIAYEYCADQPDFEAWAICMEVIEKRVLESVGDNDWVQTFMKLEAIFEQCLVKRLRENGATQVFKNCIDEKLGWQK